MPKQAKGLRIRNGEIKGLGAVSCYDERRLPHSNAMLFEYVLRTLWMLNMSHLNHHFLLWPLCVIFSGLFFSISLHFVQPTLPSLQGAVPVVFDLLFAARKDMAAKPIPRCQVILSENFYSSTDRGHFLLA
jgi:hypothetical protein